MKRSIRLWIVGAGATVAVLTCALWTRAQEGADSASPQVSQDVWGALRYLPGKWLGTGEGTPGTSEVTQRFNWILDQKFIYGRTSSMFRPTESHPDGEFHEDWMIFSYDAERKKIILRQFHNEGYVNRYVLEEVSDGGNTLQFVTESVENGPPGMRARLTFNIDSVNKQLDQNFELAMPGKDFAPCVRTRVTWQRGA